MLKQLMLTRKIQQKKTLRNALQTKIDGFKTRSEELETAIAEAQTDEEIEAVEASVEELENEQTQAAGEATALDEEIRALEEELEIINEVPPIVTTPIPEERKKGDDFIMNKRDYFGMMTRTEAETFVQRENVKSFIEDVRTIVKEKRTVTGADLTIPVEMLDILRNNIQRYSKLMNKVKLKRVNGTSRQNIVGEIPEAIWTEAVSAVEKLTVVFNQLEVDGYKVGGYVVIANSQLEDSDIDLAQEIMDALGQAIGYSIDKAIIYGRGVKMPVGIVQRLSETAKPSYYGKNERTWKALASTNLLVISQTATDDIAFFQDLIAKLGVIKSDYSKGDKVWIMNETTKSALKARALGVNAAGALVSGVTDEMPVIGGEIITLNFIPDNHIIGGYLDLFLLAERTGTKLAQSEHAMFVADNTVFKGTGRYDGRPIFGEAFVGINIKQGGTNAAPKPADVTFPSEEESGE